MRRWLTGAILILVVGCRPPAGQTNALPAVPLSVARNDAYGIAFVNGVGMGATDERYQAAVNAGVAWNRWPVYWYEVETEPGRLDDAAYRAMDAVVVADRAYGFQSNVILLGTPHWAGTAGSRSIPFPKIEAKAAAQLTKLGVGALAGGVESSPPAGLNEPVFAADGAVNPANRWARFVYTTVARYRGRVAAWELWNEPDLTDADGRGIFWTGTPEQYYRLLKVGYLAAKAADPQARVVFSGLAYWTKQDFLPAVLDLMAADGTAAANGYYFDALPLHLYSNVYNVATVSAWAADQMARRGIAKPIWVNETNLPVCGDAAVDPGFGCPQRFRGSLDEQANYVLQASALAAATGVERVFAFQHYDDSVGPHEWYGLLRNDASARPAWRAYQVAASLLRGRVVEQSVDGDVQRIAFTDAGQRTTVLWNRSGRATTARVPATSGTATLVDKTGARRSVAAVNNAYAIELPPATNRDDVFGIYPIGGDTRILIEEVPSGPSSRVEPLAELSSDRAFAVRWRRLDSGGSGDVRYDVQYRVGADGAWQDWLRDTTATTATFGPTAPVAVAEGASYYFRCRAKTGDAVEPYPPGDGDAWTTIAVALTGRVTDRRGRPVDGATVSIADGGPSATSGADGSYSLSLDPRQPQSVVAAKGGFGALPSKMIAATPGLRYDFFLPPATNWLANGDFEAELDGWTSSGSGVYLKTFRHTGRWGVWLEPPGVLSRQLTLPAGPAYLSWVYRAPSDAITGTLVVGLHGAVAATQRLPLSGAGNWRVAGLAIDGTGGQVELQLSVEGGSGSVAWLDEIALGPELDRERELFLPAIFR